MTELRATLRAIRVHPGRSEPAVELDEAVVTVSGVTGDRPKKSPVHVVAEADAGTRANLVVSLSSDELYAAVGRRLRIGEVVLAVTARPSGCPGVYAGVAEPGRLSVGDPVGEVLKNG